MLVSFLSASWPPKIWVSFSQHHGSTICEFPSPQYVSFPSIPKHCMGFISLSFFPNIYGCCFPQPYIWANNLWVSLPSPFNSIICPHPLYPNTVLVSLHSALWLPKFMGFIFPPKMSLPIPLHTQALYWFRFSLLWDSQNLWVSLPSTFNTQNMSFPWWDPPSIPKHHICFVSLSFVTTKIYWFHFPQPLDPTICEFPFPQPWTPKICPFPSWDPPQYPSTVLVLFPSAFWLPKFMGLVSLSAMAQH